MTEAEIMKALECCRDNDKNLNMEKCFDECPYKGECAGKFMADVLDLINRKNADIERLKADIKLQDKCVHGLYETLETARAEAIKDVFQTIDFMCIGTFGKFNHKAFINLKKEMGVEL